MRGWRGRRRKTSWGGCARSGRWRTPSPTEPTPPPTSGDGLSCDRAYRYDGAGSLVTVNDRTAAATGGVVDDPSTDTTGWRWARKKGHWASHHELDIALTALTLVPGLGEVAPAAMVARFARLAQVTERWGRFKSHLHSGQGVLRIGSGRTSFGRQRKYWEKLGPVKRQFARFHGHFERRYGGVDFHTRQRSYNWTWWKRG